MGGPDESEGRSPFPRKAGGGQGEGWSKTLASLSRCHGEGPCRAHRWVDCTSLELQVSVVQDRQSHRPLLNADGNRQAWGTPARDNINRVARTKILKLNSLALIVQKNRPFIDQH